MIQQSKKREYLKWVKVGNVGKKGKKRLHEKGK